MFRNKILNPAGYRKNLAKKCGVDAQKREKRTSDKADRFTRGSQKTNDAPLLPDIIVIIDSVPNLIPNLVIVRLDCMS